MVLCFTAMHACVYTSETRCGCWEKLAVHEKVECNSRSWWGPAASWPVVVRRGRCKTFHPRLHDQNTKTTKTSATSKKTVVENRGRMPPRVEETTEEAMRCTYEETREKSKNFPPTRKHRCGAEGMDSVASDLEGDTGWKLASAFVTKCLSGDDRTLMYGKVIQKLTAVGNIPLGPHKCKCLLEHHPCFCGHQRD